MRGALFETWAVAEIAKAHLHRGRRPRLSFYRDRSQLEIDLILERGADLVLVEIKSSQTPSSHLFSSLERLSRALTELEPRIVRRVVVYGGEESQERSPGAILSWRDLDTYDWIDPQR